MNALLALLVLAAVYLLTLASAKPLDVVTALVLAAALLLLLRRFLRTDAEPAAGPPLWRRLLHAPAFAVAVIVEITIGTWTVALLVLGIRKLAKPGIVQIPIGDRSETGVAVTAIAITLSPGEVLVDIDWERRVMLVHVVDASDPDAVRDHFQRFYDRFQKPVLP